LGKNQRNNKLKNVVMNIIFAVQDNKGWESVINSRFGRAEGLIFYSQKNDTLSYYSNEENTNAGHGAGIQTAQAVLNLGTEVVITGGSVGPKAFDVLKSAGIKMFSQVGEISAKEAFENFKDGKYLPLSESDK
jgi:predicted Fe-Mo cluster-binding NifX family protein